ncbi:MAG: cation transporter [Clostridia bacterium]|nr:cation transporter [Clostridia bacterium]
MRTKQKIFIAFILNFFFSIFEMIGGFITGSVAITSDAVHDFGDALSIGISYFLEKFSNKKPNKKYNYGYLRFSVLGGLITTVILLISSIIVIYSAILKFINPATVNYNGMLIFAIIGFTVNVIATYFTHGGSSINQKAVNLHMIEDALGWLIVLIGAIVIKFTKFYIIDPILSIILALVIIINAVKNLKEITNIFLVKTPKSVKIDEILEHLKHIDGVVNAHHLHVFTLDGEVNAGSVCITVNEYCSHIKENVKEELYEHGIKHATVELELSSEQIKECNLIDEKGARSCCHRHHHH